MNQKVAPNRLGHGGILLRILLVLLFSGTALLISPITTDSFLMPKAVWSSVFGVICVSTWLLRRQWSSSNPANPHLSQVSRTPLDYPLSSVFFFALLSTLFTGYSLTKGFSAVETLCLFILLYYFLVEFIRSGQSLKWLFDLGLLTSLIIAVYTFLQDRNIDFLPMAGEIHDWRFRLGSTLGNPNFVGNYLAIWLPYGFLAAYRETKPRKFVLYCLALLVIVYGLTLTFCMGAWYALAVVAGAGGIRLTVLVLKGHRLNRVRFTILVLLFLLVVGFLLSPNPWTGHPMGLLTEAKASPRWATGMGARSFIWKTTAMMVRDNPWTGVGVGNYGSAHPRYQGRLYQLRGTAHDRPTVGIVPQVHNEYYQWIAETGIVGGFALFWLLMTIFATAWRTDKGSMGRESWLLWQSSLAGLVVFLLHSFVSFPFQLPANRLVALLFLAVLIGPACSSKRLSVSKEGKGISPVVRMVAWILVLGLAFQFARPAVSGIYLFRTLRKWPADAVTGTERAIAWDRDSYDNWLYYGQALKVRGLVGEAEEAWLEASRLNDTLMVHEQLLQLYMEIGQGTKALGQMQEIMAINPCYPPNLVRLGKIQTLLGMNEEAGGSYSKAKELDPDLDIR